MIRKRTFLLCQDRTFLLGRDTRPRSVTRRIPLQPLNSTPLNPILQHRRGPPLLQGDRNPPESLIGIAGTGDRNRRNAHRLSARREKHQSSRRPRPPPLSHPVCRSLLIPIVALHATNPPFAGAAAFRLVTSDGGGHFSAGQGRVPAVAADAVVAGGWRRRASRCCARGCSGGRRTEVSPRGAGAGDDRLRQAAQSPSSITPASCPDPGPALRSHNVVLGQVARSALIVCVRWRTSRSRV